MKWLEVVKTVRLVITGFVLTWALVCLMQMAEHKLQRDLFTRPSAPYVAVNAHTNNPSFGKFDLLQWVQDTLRDVAFFWMVGN